jgi:hypothetical protein
LGERLDEAEIWLGGMETLLDHDLHKRLPHPFRPRVEGNQLSGRVVLIGTLAAERALGLAEGLAWEIEANRLFAAASIARSLMELVGLMVHVHSRLKSLRLATPPEIVALNQVTMSFLLASRSMPLASSLSLSLVRTRDMVNAARGRFGDEFGHDYGFLSDLVHPNASGAFGLSVLEETARLAVTRRPPITDSQAELLVKVLVTGLHSVSHDVLLIADWASANDLSLVGDSG